MAEAELVVVTLQAVQVCAAAGWLEAGGTRCHMRRQLACTGCRRCWAA